MERHSARASAAVLLLTVGAFQAALASGAPWGVAAYGGRTQGTLPGRLRAISAAACVGYAGAAYLVWTDHLGAPAQRRLDTGMAGLFFAGAALNAMSRSNVERAVWAPTSALLGCSLWRSRPPAGDVAPNDLVVDATARW